MKRPERVGDYLAHIVEAIERATKYIAPFRDLDDFRQNQQAQDAIIRNIEIIGEAVAKIAREAPDFLSHHPQLPRAQMRGMRNVVIHQYFFVDLGVVWTTVKDDFPRLQIQISGLLDSLRD